MAVTGAGLEGIIAAESKICFIDGDAGVLSYQGYNIQTLGEHASFEEVIFLLWNGRLPKQVELDELRAGLLEYRELPEPVVAFLKGLPKGALPMAALRTAVSMLALYDPLAQDMSPVANKTKALKLMAQTATIVTTLDRFRKGNPVVPGNPRLGFAANFLYTLSGKKPDEVMERAFDVALVLHAEHELNASTFAARVTAATLSDIYSAVTSAIGALKGPLHGGANEDVIKLLLTLKSPEEGVAKATDMLANKQKIPGLGHWVYHTLDLSGGFPERHGQGTWRAHGPCRVVRDFERDSSLRKAGQEPQRQRRFLLGQHLLLAGHPGGPVHARVCGQPHVRMDGPHPGAASQQPFDPASRGLHGRKAW